MAQDYVDEVIVVDDASSDETVDDRARACPSVDGASCTRGNRGYGGNQKTCYRLALEAGADIVIMVHPDYQYTPKLIPAMASMIGNGLYHCVLGSRILGGYALRGGMPLWTLRQQPLPDAGREPADRRQALRVPHRLPRLLPRAARAPAARGATPTTSSSTTRCWRRSSGSATSIAEVSCPTRYFAEASSINFRRSVSYGLGCLAHGAALPPGALGLVTSPLFPPLAQG